MSAAAPRTEPRTLAPPERRTAVVTAVGRLGAYALITALDAGGPQDPPPGPFYMLAAAGRGGGGPAEPGTRPLLVGGGIGAAPLLCLRDELATAPVLLGFRSAAHAEAASLFPSGAALATDDGSAGRR